MQELQLDLLGDIPPDDSGNRRRLKKPVIILLVIALVAALALIVTGLLSKPTEAPLPSEQYSGMLKDLPILPKSVEGLFSPLQGELKGSHVDWPVPKGTDLKDKSGRAQIPSEKPGDNSLVIPAIGTNATVTDEVIRKNELLIPQDVGIVGQWIGGAPLTSLSGTTLIAGHVDNINQGKGALYELHKVKSGDYVFLTRGGEETVWRIVSLQVVDKDQIPQDIFDGIEGPKRLVMVTCGGKVSHGQYDKNVIAIAELV